MWEKIALYTHRLSVVS